MIWNYPTNIRFGLDRILDSPKACTQLKIAKPLIVTDSNLAQTSIIKKLFDILLFGELILQKINTPAFLQRDS